LTVAIVSGESSLSSFTKEGGAQARYFEVQDSPFGGESKATAEIVREAQRIFAANHGHAGPVLIRTLFELKQNGGWERIRNRHLQLQNEFAQQTQGGAGDRVAGYAAALQVAAEIAVQAGLLPEASLTVVATLWPGVASQATQAPVEERALEALMSWMQGHQEQFRGRHRIISDAPIDPSGGYVGSWSKNFGWDQVSFFRHSLELILEELGFRHPDGVLRGWKDRGYLITDKDANRLERTTSFMGEPARMVAVKRSAFEKVQGRGTNSNTEGDKFDADNPKWM
jgi:hypothetical protein